jgi:hypothetical protein
VTVGAALARLESLIPSVGSQTAQFVRMVDGLAEINIGENTIQVACVGYQPPVTGMTVQVEHRSGRYVVTGPAVSPVQSGTVTAEGTPLLTVVVAGVTYSLPFLSSYTPAVGDEVEVDWSRAKGGLVLGKITTTNNPTEPPTQEGGLPQTFENLLVNAIDSGKYQSSWWGNSDVWATNNNHGAWFYGADIRSALKDKTITRAEIYLPLISTTRDALLGVHSSPTKPAGDISGSQFEPLKCRRLSGCGTTRAACVLCWLIRLGTTRGAVRVRILCRALCGSLVLVEPY